MKYKKTVIRAVILFNKTCGEQIDEQIGGEQIINVIRRWIKYDFQYYRYKSRYFVYENKYKPSGLGFIREP